MNAMIFIKLILAFIIGLTFWTFVEYNAHRYVLHGKHELIPDSNNIYIDPTEDKLYKAFTKH